MRGSFPLCLMENSQPEAGDNVKMNFHMAICKIHKLHMRKNSAEKR